MNTFLHIVCLDAPAPPDYGGAIDMYYKIDALAKAGKKIILHYFDYKKGRGTDGLKKYCVEINRYPRKRFSLLFLFQPYIISSRNNKNLLKRLNADSYPILIEGVHCAGLIPYLHDKRRVVLRMHNEEVSYYRQLSLAEASLWKRLYFQWESSRLHRFQMHLNKKLKLAVLSQSDIAALSASYQFTETNFIPCFLPWQKISGTPGKGIYCLYHGNLSVAENEKAALWLINEVFISLQVPLIIAGRGMSTRLKKAAAKVKNVSLIAEPSLEQLEQLIREAHINVLPSFNSTGVKLKLLHALFCGRFVISNSNGIKGSGICEGIAVEDTASGFISRVDALMSQAFSTKEMESRDDTLALYNNGENAEKLMKLW